MTTTDTLSRADDNYARNGIRLEADIGTWTTARDGSLTTRTADGRWFADCSVPLLAGRAMLKSVEPSALAVCLLAPPHAGVLMAARERLGRRCPILVIQPDVAAVRHCLGALDLSDDLATKRLCIVTGIDWPDRLRSLYDEHPGLATPSQFVRAKSMTDAEADELMATARGAFAEVAEKRSAWLRELRNTPAERGANGNVILVGNGSFRPWHPSLAELARLLPSADRFDADDPLCTSPVSLAVASRGGKCLVTADVYRQDVADFVDDSTPILIRASRPTVRPPTNPLDGLLVPDATWAAGWPADRVAVVPWWMPWTPVIGRHLGLIGDTKAIDPPPSVKSFSSHVLLWDAIEAELFDRPLLAADAGRYLTGKIDSAGLDPQSVDAVSFIDDLIAPAFQQGVARLLLRGGLPIACFGEGWTDLDEFIAVARGPVDDEADFTTAIADCAALVHHWPTTATHPIDAAGRPVVRATDADQSAFLRRARSAVRAAAVSPSADLDLMSHIERLLHVERI